MKEKISYPNSNFEKYLVINIFSQVFFECEYFPNPFVDIYEIFTSWS